jgi:hypothetical protein
MQSLSRILKEACGVDRIKDTVKGGLADKLDPSEFDQEELMTGIHVEMEHTNDILQAMEIAMDHLFEDPAYYEKLASIHQEAGDDDLASNRQNANLKRTWQRVWKGKQ